nr:Glycos_transf_1 [uncultured Ruminococcus sp.]
MRVARELHLEKNIIWLSNEHDMQALYSASDAMIFPSLYEGLPMALVEAQAAGLPCFMSDTVSSETVISDSCVVLPIDQGIGPWVRAITTADLPSTPVVRASGAGQVVSHGFDISDVAHNLEDIYSVKTRI